MIGHLHHQVSSITTTIVCVGTGCGSLVGHQVESITGVYCEVLVFGGMVYAVLPDELEGIIGFVLFEDANCAFGECDAETVFLRVEETDEVL